MRSRFCLGCLLLCLTARPSGAETRRALLVGITTYLPSIGGRAPSAMTQERLKAVHGRPSRIGLRELAGSFNDAADMKNILVSRFGFEDGNVIVLPNALKPATADNILELLRTHLIEKAQKGDVSLFYYSGHGSRIRNPATENPDKMDSTIIPADAMRGVPDIRGKELAKLYMEAVKKGVRLTVIQDSCFSGAGARGTSGGALTKAEPEDAAVSVDEPWQGALPEDSGVLIMTASQDYQEAIDLRETDLGKAHGAFTWALLHVLSTSPANERVDRIFARTRALMQSNTPAQEPILFAKNGRGGQDLLGLAAAEGPRVVSVATAKVDRAAGKVALNAGTGMGLYPDSVLKRITPKDPPVSLRITATTAISLSEAAVVAGRLDDVKPGDLFQLDQWRVPEHAALRVFTGAPLPLAEIQKAAARLAPLRGEAAIHWIADPVAETPSHVLSWDGAARAWTLRENIAGREPVPIGQPDPAAVLARLKGAKGVRLYLNLPLATEVAAGLEIGAKSVNAGVAVVDTPTAAHYVLLGRTGEKGQLEYCWALPNLTEEDLARQAAEASKRGQAEPIVPQPLHTDWYRLGVDKVAENLTKATLRLATVIGWLQLEAPKAQQPFPFHLAVREQGTEKRMDGGVLTGGKTYVVSLEPEPGVKPAEIAPRRVYAFAIDSWGCGSLIFPPSEAELHNVFPRPGQDPDLYKKLTIPPPYGTDTYLLVTSGSSLGNPRELFNFAGVQSSPGIRGGSMNPLARLLSQNGGATRGAPQPVPTDWSIERHYFKSVPGPPGTELKPAKGCEEPN